MRLLLDTHVLLWWHNEPERLTETAYDAICDLDNEIFLSVVNGWEIQIKTQLGKLTLSKPLNVIRSPTCAVASRTTNAGC